MTLPDEQVRAIIADQAGDWFMAHRGGSLDPVERRAFEAWLTASAIHLEEYLGVALIARRLPAAADDPEMPLEAILERVRQEEAGQVAQLATASSGAATATRRASPARFWPWAAIAASIVGVVTTLLWWNGNRVVPQRYATSHGEMRTWRLSDNSEVHLNTDTTLTLRYSKTERLVEIERGEALFQVTHDAARPFRVVAGTANIVAVGTTFDVYRETAATLVTVVDGRVVVGASDLRVQTISAIAGEQIRVAPGQAPSQPMPADIDRRTAWLRHQIVFEEEPLAQVAAEFNRYSSVPIVIENAGLRTLAISGTFSAGDTETFVAFLRTLDGVIVEVTPNRIRVSKK